MQNSALPPVKLDSFEGPFDLLIELARSHKIDLAEISLRTITDDFLAYLNQNKLSASVQADFLIVAATLMLIKIRQLLPKLTDEEEQEIETLTDRVRIYQLYRQQAGALARRWGMRRLLPAHFWAANTPILAPLPALQSGLTAADLRTALQGVIKGLPKPARPRAHLTVRGRTMQEWLKMLTERLARVQELIFQDTLRGSSRQDAAVSFLAVLELARKREIQLTQSETYSKLIIKRTP